MGFQLPLTERMSLKSQGGLRTWCSKRATFKSSDVKLAGESSGQKVIGVHFSKAWSWRFPRSDGSEVSWRKRSLLESKSALTSTVVEGGRAWTRQNKWHGTSIRQDRVIVELLSTTLLLFKPQFLNSCHYKVFVGTVWRYVPSRTSQPKTSVSINKYCYIMQFCVNSCMLQSGNMPHPKRAW